MYCLITKQMSGIQETSDRVQLMREAVDYVVSSTLEPYACFRELCEAGEG